MFMLGAELAAARLAHETHEVMAAGTDRGPAWEKVHIKSGMTATEQTRADARMAHALALASPSALPADENGTGVGSIEVESVGMDCLHPAAAASSGDSSIGRDGDSGGAGQSEPERLDASRQQDLAILGYRSSLTSRPIGIVSIVRRFRLLGADGS